MSNFSYFKNKTKGTVTVVPLERADKTFTVHSSNPNYQKILEALANPENVSTDDMIALCSPAKAIAKATEDYHGIEVVNGALLYEGEPVGNSLAARILDIFASGLPVEPWALFAERLYRNPSKWVRDELDLWLAESDLPITNDGCFLAYKKVKSNYTDCHTGTFDNSVGKTPSMPREKVDADRSKTCSTGLHFCSKSYLDKFWGDRVMILKVDPEDVVSIPNDYNNAKGRAWRYQVIGEIKPEEVQTKKWAPTTDFGSEYPAKVLDKPVSNKNPSGIKNVNIETVHQGKLNSVHMNNALNKYGSAVGWAKKLGVAPSTVRGWKSRFEKEGVKFDVG